MADSHADDPSLRLISYAENLEDIALYRALKHVERGRYVDVGAAWPEFDSVTQLFYERGWSGINVEPNPDLFAELQRARTRDVNLGVALGACHGQATFAVVLDTGLSTLDQSVADRLRRNGRGVRSIDVTVETLTSVLDTHMPSGEIHFLKIDVEGAEGDVIAGNDWTRFRPWIVVVELVNPASEGQIAEPPWEAELLAVGYRGVHDDGINRFYVADEHADLANAFEVPPNVIDGFVTVRQVRADDALVAAEIEIERLEWQLGIETGRVATEADHARWLEQEIAIRDQRLAIGDQRLAASEAQLVLQRQDTRNQLLRLRLEVAEARAEVSKRDDAAADLQQHVDFLTLDRDLLHRHVNTMMQSKSWQLTRPVRLAYSFAYEPAGTTRRIVSRLLGTARLSRVRRMAAVVRRRTGVVAVPDQPAAAPSPTPWEDDFLAMLSTIVPSEDSAAS